jgi:hypothetical protein
MNEWNMEKNGRKLLQAIMIKLNYEPGIEFDTNYEMKQFLKLK